MWYEFTRALFRIGNYVKAPDSGDMVGRLASMYEWLIAHGYSPNDAYERILELVHDAVDSSF